MGNKRNRTPRRKKPFCNLNKKWAAKTTQIVKTANNNINAQNPTQPTVAVSVRCPISDTQLEPHTQLEHKYTVDPLFVVKSEVKSPSFSDRESNEIAIVGTTIAVVKIEPRSEETVMQVEEHTTAIENKCRLCLTKDESNWIDIFSNEPYPYANVNEITRSNIVEIIQQFTTIKIAKDDQLPDKLCLQCFQSLRFIYKFREKSLRAQNLLNSELNAISESSSEHNQQSYGQANSTQLQAIQRMYNDVRMKPIRKPVPSPKKNLTFEEAFNKDNEKFESVQCEICGEVFDKYKPFQYHLNRHHDVRPFACTDPYCHKRFFSLQNRQLHILNAHSSERKFKCDLCEKQYNRAERLTHHRSTHFPPTIPCKICGKLLRSQASVRKHRASHAERTYKCDCGKSFQNQYTLTVHRRIHTNEKPFICSKCGEAFAHKCSLKTHDEKKHPSN